MIAFKLELAKVNLGSKQTSAQTSSEVGTVRSPHKRGDV